MTQAVVHAIFLKINCTARPKMLVWDCSMLFLVIQCSLSQCCKRCFLCLAAACYAKGCYVSSLTGL